MTETKTSLKAGMRCRADRAEGFTLIEVMVAAVIGAFVALVGVGTLRAITSGREKLDDHLAATAQLRFVTNMLRRDLANLYRDASVKLEGMVDAQGSAPSTRLVFHTINRSKARPNGIESDFYEVEYLLVQEGEQPVLMRRLWPNPDRDLEPKGVLTAIGPQVVGFAARFHDGEDWQEEWTEEQRQLPQIVEIMVMVKTAKSDQVLTSRFLVNFSRWPQGESDGQRGNAPDGGLGNNSGNRNDASTNQNP